VRARLQEGHGQQEVVALVAAPPTEVRSRIGRWADVRPVSRQTCQVRIRTDGFEWAAMALAMTESEFEVQSPAEFRQYLSDWSARLGRAGATEALRPPG
jgi:predicted DNA-binding transcriptional regulator YafY